MAVSAEAETEASARGGGAASRRVRSQPTTHVANRSRPSKCAAIDDARSARFEYRGAFELAFNLSFIDPTIPASPTRCTSGLYKLP